MENHLLKSCAILLILGSGVLLQNAKTPILIAEIWRHGVRSAAFNTLDQDYVKKEGKGNIVGNGVRMHYLLGRSIRRKYENSIFKNDPTWETAKVYTSQYQRTALSGESHMMGIFPAGTGQKITGGDKDKIHKPDTPIPDDIAIKGDFGIENGIRVSFIEQLNIKEDRIFNKGMSHFCQPQEKINHDLAAKKMKELDPIFDDIRDQIEKIVPAKEKYQREKHDLQSIGWFADVAKCNYYYTGELLSGVTEELMEKLRWIFGINYISEDYLDENSIRMWTDQLTKKILTHFKDKAKMENPDGGLKFLGFSGHESNIIPYLMKLNQTSMECMIRKYKREEVEGPCEENPGFAASLLFELSREQNTNNHFVQIIYNDKPIPWAKNAENKFDNYGTLAQFEELYKNELSIDDLKFKSICSLKETPSENVKDSTAFSWTINWLYVALALGILVAIQCIVVIFFILTSCKKTQPSSDVENSLISKGLDY